MEQGFEIALDPISRHRRPRRLTPARLEKPPAGRQNSDREDEKFFSFFFLSLALPHSPRDTFIVQDSRWARGN